MDYPNHITNHEKGKHLALRRLCNNRAAAERRLEAQCHRKEGAELRAQYRAQHHQEGHDTAVQWQGVPLQG